MSWLVRFLSWAAGKKALPSAPQQRVQATSQRPGWEQDSRRVVLHLGCGPDRLAVRLAGLFPASEWREVRVDADSAVEPDWCIDLISVAQEAPAKSADLLFCSHALEHLPLHEAQAALAGWRRLLRPSGLLIVMVPDLQAVAAAVVHQGLHHPLYESPMGPIAAHDILYGHGASLAAGRSFMAHRSGFTAESLAHALQQAGYGAFWVAKAAPFQLVAFAASEAKPFDAFREAIAPFAEALFGADPLFNAQWQNLCAQGS